MKYWFGYEQRKNGKMEEEPRVYFKSKEGDRWWLVASPGFTRGSLVAEIARREKASIEVPRAFRKALEEFDAVPKFSAP